MSTPIRITLNAQQASLLSPVLELAKQQNGFEGVLCSLSRAYSPETGGTVLELHVVHVLRGKVAKVLKLLSE